MRIARTFGFGPARGASNAMTPGGGGPGGGGMGGRGGPGGGGPGGGGGMRMGGGGAGGRGGMGGMGGDLTEHRYQPDALGHVQQRDQPLQPRRIRRQPRLPAVRPAHRHQFRASAEAAAPAAEAPAAAPPTTGESSSKPASPSDAWWGGRPRPRGSPWTRFRKPINCVTAKQADGGVGCGPGRPPWRPPHHLCRFSALFSAN